MNRPEDLQYVSGIPVKKVTTTAASGIIDTQVSSQRAAVAILRFVHDASTTKQIYRAVHCSASSTLFASGTAFTTAVAASAVTSGQTAFILDTTGMKRYIRVRISSVTTSSNTGAFADLMYNKAMPPSSTLGFASVTKQGA